MAVMALDLLHCSWMDTRQIIHNTLIIMIMKACTGTSE